MATDPRGVTSVDVDALRSAILEGLGGVDSRLRAEMSERLDAQHAILVDLRDALGRIASRVSDLESRASEETVRRDERRKLTEEQQRRLAPVRDSLARRGVDIVLALIGAGIMAWIITTTR